MMKIATWNLESVKPLGADRKTAFRMAIKDLDAHVLILTETWVEAHLEPVPGYVVAAQSSPADDLTSTPERCWVSIWVRDGIAHAPIEIHDQSDRMAGVRITSPDWLAMVVVGTVLPWNSDSLWPGADGFCRAVAEQAAEWGRIRALHRDCTFFIAGDFNQSLPGVSHYGSKRGEETLSGMLCKQDLFCLTPGNVWSTGKPRIDHICIGRNGLQSPYLPAMSEWVVPVSNGNAITDHTGVAIELPDVPVARKTAGATLGGVEFAG